MTKEFDSPEDIPDLIGKLPPKWQWIQTRNVIKSLRNGIYKPKEYYNDSGTASLRMYNIKDGRIVWEDIKRMELTDEEREKYALEPGDILVNRVNSRELVGKAAYIPNGIEECVFESKNIRVRPNDNVNGKYLAYWFYFFRKHYFMSQVKQTVGQATITQAQIKQMPLPLPPLEEQHQIVAKIEELFSKLDSGLTDLQDVKHQLTLYKRSLLQEAMTGKLTSTWRAQNI